MVNAAPQSADRGKDAGNGASPARTTGPLEGGCCFRATKRLAAFYTTFPLQGPRRRGRDARSAEEPAVLVFACDPQGSAF